MHQRNDSAAPVRNLARLLLLTGGLAAAADLSAQSDWTQLSPTTSPAARFGHAMTYDIARDRVVMFGGWTSAGRSQSDTWEFDGSNWLQLTPTMSPPGRDGHSLVYDLASGRTVLFGGDLNGTVSADTWTWDGSNWTQENPTTVPAARKSYMITYDFGRGRIVMFGGNNAGTFLSDTWEWSNQNWSLVQTATAPSNRIASAMAHDPVGGGVILFSGYQTTNDTWRFDGTNWTQLMPATQPIARFDYTLATDMARQRIVMFGVGSGNADTWEWTGQDWLQRQPTTLPSRRLDHDIAYDWARERTVIFGGSTSLGDTWTYAPNSPAAWSTFGMGCRGSNGSIPALVTTDRPWLGESFDLRITGLAPNSASTIFTGFSDTTFNGLPLPFDMSPLGLTGCSLLIELLVDFPLNNVNGSATWTLPIPNAPALAGLRFFNQTANLDAGANRANVTLSNGSTGTVGAK